MFSFVHGVDLCLRIQLTIAIVCGKSGSSWNSFRKLFDVFPNLFASFAHLFKISDVSGPVRTHSDLFVHLGTSGCIRMRSDVGSGFGFIQFFDKSWMFSIDFLKKRCKYT